MRAVLGSVFRLGQPSHHELGLLMGILWADAITKIESVFVATVGRDFYSMGSKPILELLNISLDRRDPDSNTDFSILEGSMADL